VPTRFNVGGPGRSDASIAVGVTTKEEFLGGWRTKVPVAVLVKP
jgi:hypothetical protein